MKKLVAIICLMVLCTQVLPVQQMGALLFGNQLNEETNQHSDSGKEDVSKHEIKSDYCVSHVYHNENILSAVIAEYLHCESLLPLNHSAEIHTPPPNILLFV